MGRYSSPNARMEPDVPYRVIEIQPTPNPNALKFVLDQVIAIEPRSYFFPAAAVDDPLGRRIFEIPGVRSLLFLSDFVTVNKSSEARWADIKKAVRRVLSAS